MNRIMLVLLLVLSGILFSVVYQSNTARRIVKRGIARIGSISYYGEVKSDKIVTSSLIERGDAALKYCKANDMNVKVCILIDMRIHSGKNRLVVWDMKNKQVIKKSLVSHGAGKGRGRYGSKNNARFSNKRNSHLSSLGKYKIGNRASSRYGHGIKYWLKGLESSNNNASSRVVVLHGWKPVKNSEVYPKGTKESWGCPAVSISMMRYLDKQLMYKDNVLLWIYK